MPNVVIPLMRMNLKAGIRKDLPLWDRLNTYQLVGEVMAHQGYDG